MSMRLHISRLARAAAAVGAMAAAALFGGGACSREGGPGASEGFGDGSTVFIGGIKCAPILSAEPLPARAVVTNPETAGGDENVFSTGLLFQRFGTYCGTCHVAQASGGFQVSRATFGELVTQDLLDRRVKVDNPDPVAGATFMPPTNAGGKAWSARLADPNDPVVELVTLLETWIRQGSPAGQFFLTPPDGADGGAPEAGATAAGAAATSDYSLTPEQGAGLTNIGSCVPNRYTVGLNAQTMNDLDGFFAGATELPDTLAETDLTTFDSDTLARNGVLSYVPAYPLWSDSAGKMRHVRAPRGQPIVFDRAAQRFDIPPNTRFYKTFLKAVVDAAGSVAHRKIETRLIVARPDRTLPDGTVEHTALFGTYLWDAGETRAVLLRDPLHNGKPFSDRVLTYVADEPRAQTIRDGKPLNLDYAFDVQNPGVRRHYGVPGSERCIQCHMGSPSASFVLGFTPLQIATVAPGTSGSIEPSLGDERTQLQRLLWYGLIAGMASPAEVTPLEKTQLPRAPRNDQELAAQAYMVGNCSHCHNPRGFPSVKAPELRDALNFLPGPDGGIFQFPLERTSPRRGRGPAQEVPIPYITPSLRDLPDVNGQYPRKYQRCEETGDELTDTTGWCTKLGLYNVFIEAPWRSLIYRNVDTPFDYVDDYTIFPHMPMHTSGFDCRAPRIMGDWMVSIPAVRCDPTTPGCRSGPKEDAVGPSGDDSPQPYVEVTPDDPRYAAARSDAAKRLAAYHAGHRYDFCPSTLDIVDPAVNGDPLTGRLTPADVPIFDNSSSPPRQIMPADAVPNRPHWVVSDATDPPGDWLPRGDGWRKALVDHVVDDPSVAGQALADLEEVLRRLRDVRLTPELRAALVEEVPFGIWQQKPGCGFRGVPRAGTFQGDARPYWMDRTRAAPDAPVYLASAGAAVFQNICVNCHGPRADAKGLLAEEISVMTGGDARVANFRTGLFGPLEAPAGNRQSVFALPDGTADEYGARYLSWMALGGTKKRLPPDLLQIVAISPVLGQRRSGVAPAVSANMLQLAQTLCANVLLSEANHSSGGFNPGQPLSWTGQTLLVADNGDAELWLKLCSLGNRPVVRVPNPIVMNQRVDGRDVPSWVGFTLDAANLQSPSLYWGADETGQPLGGAGARFLDHRGRVRTGLAPDNLLPVCLREPAAGSAERAAADAYRDTHPAAGGDLLPYCPAELFEKAGSAEKWRLATAIDGNGSLRFPDANAWAIRGAINAGSAVFLYVDQLSKGAVQPKPAYNQCELLKD